MVPRFVARDRGHIVLTGSLSGYRGLPGAAAYVSSKAGVMALTRCSGLEAAEYGIRINAVSPSIVFHDHLRKSAPEALLNELASREAFGRGAEAFEIANVMVFLASDYASYLVGEVISASSQRA